MTNKLEKAQRERIDSLRFKRWAEKLYLYWFTLNWWKYLLGKKCSDYSWWKVIKCRATGHKCGVVWYSSGFEPDMTCKGCGDDLG